MNQRLSGSAGMACANRIPVLAYHALHAPGTTYATNDHLALEEDLRVIRAHGFRVAPLMDVATYVTGEGAHYLAEGSWVGLSFDDGTDWDYHDFYDPTIGHLKSFLRTLKESGSDEADPGHWPQPTGVSFVIASPEARSVLDRTCIAGRDNWRDTWWKEAAQSGILGIGNHSWDHVHHTLPIVAQREQRKGTFFGIDEFADAEIQIRQAEEFIFERAGGATSRLFAYPYGEAPHYLVEEYFPRFREQHRIFAAFITGGGYATIATNRWKIPRFICGEHWKTPNQLGAILSGANC
ncbi:MAG: hypothetical protein ACR2HE_12800 [Casimicrobiaceae bacterium]